MVQAAEDRQRADASERHGGSTKWGVSAEREVSARRIVIGGIIGQQATQLCLSAYHKMVEALAPDGTNQSLDVAILPGRTRRSWSVADAHGAQPPPEYDTIHTITVTDQIPRRLIPGECLGYLPRNPISGRVRRHVYVEKQPSFQTQDDQPVQQRESNRRHHEQVNCRDLWRMIA